MLGRSTDRLARLARVCVVGMDDPDPGQDFVWPIGHFDNDGNRAPFMAMAR
jgi:hypothetical protein